MEIGIVGLGLIGGSLAKTIKKHTEHTVYGRDLHEPVVLKAKLIDAIDGELTEERLGSCSLLILALYPDDTVRFLRENAARIRPGTIVVDCCGIKRPVCAAAFPLAKQYGFSFVGGHPMAGIEFSGFDYANGTLFEGASMILVPDPLVEIAVLDQLKTFFLSAGFGSIKLSTPEEHDHVIAYTSQLAHVLSSAYVKSPSALAHVGFSAGSFKDMTRVATLNETMWTELFLENKDYLAEEVAGLISRLQNYLDAITSEDAETLRTLLREGRERKAVLNQKELNL